MPALENQTSFAARCADVPAIPSLSPQQSGVAFQVNGADVDLKVDTRTILREHLPPLVERTIAAMPAAAQAS